MAIEAIERHEKKQMCRARKLIDGLEDIGYTTDNPYWCSSKNINFARVVE